MRQCIILTLIPAFLCLAYADAQVPEETVANKAPPNPHGETDVPWKMSTRGESSRKTPQPFLITGLEANPDVPVTDESLSHLRDATGLDCLDLRGTAITDAGLKNLSGLQGLHTLDISGTGITDAGLSHVRGLPLQTLHLNRSIRDAGLIHLKHGKRLRHLTFDIFSKVSDDGLEHLEGLTALEELRIPGSLVTDAGLRHVTRLKSLQVLVLSDTGVTDGGLEYLMKLKSLRSLAVHNTKVTRAGVEKLQAALPDCKVHHFALE